jgi:hypothetical protein
MAPAFKVGDYVGKRGRDWVDFKGYKPTNTIAEGPFKIIMVHENSLGEGYTTYTYEDISFMGFTEVPNDSENFYWFKWPTVDGKPSEEYKIGDPVPPPPKIGGKRSRRSKSKSRKGRKGRKTTRRH